MNWSIDAIVENKKDGTIKLDFWQLQSKGTSPTTDHHVRQILSKDDLDCRKVTYVVLTICSLITDEALKLIGQHCTKLEALYMYQCSNVTDEGIQTVIKRNKNIKYLCFSECKKITAATITSIVDHAPCIKLIDASSIDLSYLPTGIQYGKLRKLKSFRLGKNNFKRLPPSIANLPDNCKFDLDGNPLEQRLLSMANDEGPAGIGRYYAEELCERSNFNLQMLDSYVKECGLNSSDGSHRNFQVILQSIRSKANLNDHMMRECEERFAVVYEGDKSLIQDLIHEGKRGLYLHAICKSYFLTPNILQYCLDNFGYDCASKRNRHGLTPFELLATNPFATDECKSLLSSRQAVADDNDDPLDYDIYANSLVNVVDQVESGSKTNFSVGLFSPFGAGKSKLWGHIKKITKQMEKSKVEKWKKEHLEEHRDAREERSRNPGYLAFTMCCDIMHCACCRKKRKDHFDDKEMFDDDEEIGKTSGCCCSTKRKNRFDDDGKIGGPNKSFEKKPLLQEARKLNSYETREIETLAVVMVTTWFVWVPFLFVPLFLFSCIFISRVETPSDTGTAVSKVLADRDYVPLHIYSDEFTHNPITCFKTAIIMIIRMFPFSSIGSLFTCSCFTNPRNRQIVPVNKRLFIDFNAWVFNGSDTLWASLMESMWRSVEFQYGRNAVRLHRASINLAGEKPGDPRPLEIRTKKRAMALYKFYAEAFISLLISSGGIIGGLFFMRKYGKLVLSGGAIIGIVATQLPLFASVVTFVLNVLPELLTPPFSSLMKDERNQRHDFSSNTGFMGRVKQEIDYLFDFLQTQMYYDKVNRCKRPVRFSIFVDDLDRCDSKTVVKVLQAMKLLLDNDDNQMVTCWTAIDTRLIVASIDKEFGGVLNAADVDGYDFIDKFIEFPFCVPELSVEKKAGVIERLFLKKYVQNPHILYESMKAVQVRVESITSANHRFEIVVVRDLKVFCEFAIPNFSWAKYLNDEETNLVSFLCKIKDSAKTSKDVKAIFRGKEKYLSAYSGSAKDNEAILTLAAKYMKCVEMLYSTLAQGNQDGVEMGIRGKVDMTSKHDSVSFSHSYVGDNRCYDGCSGHIAVDSDEIDWFNSYSKYLEGEPRAMSRILNIYLVARGIAEQKLKPIDMNKMFRKKLLKTVSLTELWPYRMSWLLLLSENALEEEELWMLMGGVDLKVEPSNEWNKSLATVMQRFGTVSTDCTKDEIMKGCTMTEIFSKVSLFEAYQKVSRVLMHSPQDSRVEMSRDSDPQLFEQFLLEKNENMNDIMMLSDIMPLNHKKFVDDRRGHTLRPFIFNLQSHMLEKASKNMENIAIHVVEGENNEPWRVKYEPISGHFHN